jgi:hypothetical protein
MESFTGSVKNKRVDAKTNKEVKSERPSGLLIGIRRELILES